MGVGEVLAPFVQFIMIEWLRSPSRRPPPLVVGRNCVFFSFRGGCEKLAGFPQDEYSTLTPWLALLVNRRSPFSPVLPFFRDGILE